jgi:hypothetical protein
LKLRKLRKLPQLLELLVEVSAEVVLVILAFVPARRGLQGTTVVKRELHEIAQSARRSRGGTSRASASLRSVRGCGLATVSCSILRMVAGLTSASFASSRCDRDRSSRSRLTLAPVVSFTAIIVANFVSFRRRIATDVRYRILWRMSTKVLQNEGD